MAGALRKTMEYLGLAEADERYDAYDDYDSYDEADGREPVDRETEREEHAPVTHLPQRNAPTPRVVRDGDVGPLTRITTIHPRTYNEAKNIGENFRDGVPVIMNLTDMDDSDAKRLVDFAAGLVFGLHGAIERVTNKVFLLSPSHVEVATSAPTATAKASHSLFNQS
jgi:cell division inhibitor SepF